METDGITEICEVNDDCLIAIFKQLKIDDLCAVASVCQRFRAIAQYIFSLKYGQQFNMNEKVPLQIFRAFGSQMMTINLCIREFYDKNKKLTVCERDFRRTINAQLKYCPNLKQVNVSASKWTINEKFRLCDQNIHAERNEKSKELKQNKERKRNSEVEANTICAKRIKLESPTVPLNSLNRSALLAIFDQLNLSDLSSIAETSKQFQYLARYVFHKKNADSFVLDRNTEPRTMRIFGHLIRKMAVKFTRYKNSKICELDQMEMLRLIHRYGKNIFHLYINTNIHRKLFRSRVLGEIFTKIKVLTIKLECNYDMKYYQDIENTMQKCQNLLSLAIIPRASGSKRECYEPFLMVKYPLLRHFSICGLTILNDAFAAFCTNHTKLISLKLAVTRINQSAAMSIINLKNLRALQFVHDDTQCMAYDYTNLYTALAKISTLRNVIVVNWNDALLHVKQLTGLVIIDTGNESTRLWKMRARSIATDIVNLKHFGLFTQNLPLHLIDLVRNSKALQSIYVDVSGFPDNRIFDKLLSAVKFRKGYPLHIFTSGQQHVSNDRLINYSHMILVSDEVAQFWGSIIYTGDFDYF